MSRLLPVTILLLIFASTDARAWFIFIPGSVVGKVSDAISGDKGEHCVGKNVKIGDAIRVPSGAILTVRSLSPSSRCPNAALPIRAHLDSSPSISFRPKASIELPVFWEKKQLTYQQLLDGGVILANNPAIDSGLYISAKKREGTPDMTAVAIDTMAKQSGPFEEPQKSEIKQIAVNGMRAWRYEVTGKAKDLFSKSYTYLTTIIEGEEEIVTLSVWAPVNILEKQRTLFEQLAGTITGISPPPTSSAVDTHVPPDVVNKTDTAQTDYDAPLVTSAPSSSTISGGGHSSVTTETEIHKVPAFPTSPEASSSLSASQPASPAQRLRELNSLLKEGLIDKKEYAEKKRKILDAM